MKEVLLRVLQGRINEKKKNKGKELSFQAPGKTSVRSQIFEYCAQYRRTGILK